MPAWLAVALGGAAGSVARYYSMQLIADWMGSRFPWGTLTVNLAGSFVMGVLVALLASVLADHGAVRALLTTGFLGGYTTFSTFSLDLVVLMDRGALGAALIYGAASVVLGVIGLLLGRMVIRMMVGA